MILQNPNWRMYYYLNGSVFSKNLRKFAIATNQVTCNVEPGYEESLKTLDLQHYLKLDAFSLLCN